MTTDSNRAFNIAPNLLDQGFSAALVDCYAIACRAMDGPNQKWAGDISYIWTSEGWLYPGVILDPYSWRVIGWNPRRRHSWLGGKSPLVFERKAA